MSKKNSLSQKKIQLQQATTNKRLPYRQPEVYSLGSLEQVQSYPEGYGTDATQWYYSSS